MNTTIRHIEFLVSTHNCVVIPGIGAILAHRKSAQISADGMSIMPPCRVYTFNGDLTQTDGLVEQSVARGLQISYERATSIVSSDVDTMRHQLANGHSVSLGRIGTLESDAEGNVQFKAFECDGITPGMSWLQPLDLSKAKPIVNADEEEVTVGRTRRILSPVARFARGVAAAAVVAVIAFASSTPITIKDANYASIALPEVKAPKAEYVPSTALPILNLVDNKAAQATPVDTAARAAYQRAQKMLAQQPMKAEQKAVQPQSVEAPVQAKAAPAIRFNDNDAYCIIVASVNNTEEAQEYIEEAKRKYGERCELLKQDGRFRIYAGTAATTVAAREMISSSIAKRHPGAWVCAR
jgi:hypothetical protein